MLARTAFIAFLWQQAARLSEFLIVLLMTKFTAMYLGPKNAGIYGLIGSALGLALIGTQLGFEASANNFLAKESEHPGRVSFLIRTLFVRRLLISLGVGAGIFILAPWLAIWQKVPEPGYFRLAALVLVLSTTSTLLSYFLLALFKNKEAMIVRVLALIFQILFLVWLLQQGYGIWGALIAQGAGALLMLLGFAWMNIQLARPKPESIEMKPVYRFGITLWIQELMNFALSKSTGMLLLGAFAISADQIGFYNVAFNLRFFFDNLLIMGMGATALAATARLAQKGSDQLPIAWLYNLKATTFLSVPTMVFFLLHTKAGLIFLSSREFINAEGVCRWLLVWGIVTRIYGGGASSTVLTADGKERLVLQQNLIGGLANIALACVFIPISKPFNQELLAIAFATGASTTLMSYLGYAAVKRSYHVKFPVRYTVEILIASGLAMLATYPLQSNHLLMLIPSSMAYVVVFVVLLYLIKPFEEKDVEIAGKVSGRMGKIIGKFAKPKASDLQEVSA